LPERRYQRSTHRRLESQETSENRLLAVEIDGVGTGQQVGDLVPRLHPAIKACGREQTALQSLLSRHHGRSFPADRGVAGEAFQPAVEQIVERPPVDVR